MIHQDESFVSFPIEILRGVLIVFSARQRESPVNQWEADADTYVTVLELGIARSNLLLLKR